MVVGVDGCKGGWLAISLALSWTWEMGIFANFLQLWKKYHHAGLILVDIPIGLKERGPGERLCDREARIRLGRKRASSVFPAPYRPTIYYARHNPDYQEVSLVNRKSGGKGISRQTFGIIPKIREMDEFLRKYPEARKVVRETHPEICFWALNGGRPLAYSKTRKGEKEKGWAERLDILERIFPPARDLFGQGLASFRRREVLRDDLLDALAAAVTALLGMGKLTTLPPVPETDSLGLPMEIAYYLPE